MTMPQPVNAGLGPEYGPPAVVVHEWAPGVEVVQDIGPGFNAPGMNIVPEYGPGVRRVYFEGGLPPHLDPTWQARQQMMQAAAAEAAQQAVDRSQQMIHRDTEQATQQATWLLTVL